MFMNKIFISLFIITLTVVGLYVLLHSPKTTVVPTETKTEEVPKPALIIDKSLIVEKTYTEPTDYAIFEVSYPQFKNTSTEFNKKIEDSVLEGVALHKKDAEDNWKARYSTSVPVPRFSELDDERFMFSVSWEPAQVNQNFISFILVVSGYVGGAHGYQNIISWNYDVKAKTEMALKDLFSSDPNYLKTVSEFSRAKLKAKFGKDANEEMLMQGTMPTVENFSVFTFTPDSITLYFTQYQVAPYAMGESTVVIPRQ